MRSRVLNMSLAVEVVFHEMLTVEASLFAKYCTVL
jgi:hypothetical protein